MTSSISTNALIVGASAAGVTVAETLRAEGYGGSITLLGAERHRAYDRPPLSKHYLSGSWERHQLDLRAENHLANLDVREVLGVTAGGLDVSRRSVVSTLGREFDYDRLVIATGVTPRRMPDTIGIPGVHVLRTVEDAAVLRAEIAGARTAVIVGGGFIGAEVAAVLATAGLDVTLVSAGSHLLGSVLGEHIGKQLTALHRSHGVTVLDGPSARVQSVELHSGTAVGVTLRDGRVVRADVVLSAIGSDPSVGWLAGSPLGLNDGVLCAQDCSAAPGVYAAGDVARWVNPLFGVSMRVEHRTNAIDQAIHVAREIVHDNRAPYAPVPYFWSDQFGLKIQSYGWLRNHDESVLIDGSLDSGRTIVLYRRGLYLTGVVAVGAAKALRGWRAHIAARMLWADALALATT